jgi:hypothetical protein
VWCAKLEGRPMKRRGPTRPFMISPQEVHPPHRLFSLLIERMYRRLGWRATRLIQNARNECSFLRRAISSPRGRAGSAPRRSMNKAADGQTGPAADGWELDCPRSRTGCEYQAHLVKLTFLGPGALASRRRFSPGTITGSTFGGRRKVRQRASRDQNVALSPSSQPTDCLHIAPAFKSA